MKISLPFLLLAALFLTHCTAIPLYVPANAVVPTEVTKDGFAAGNTAGTLKVAADGDLIYDFPLWVPPGRNGVQPELSLNYRGRGSDGHLGVGWSIGGLSQISRCAQTRAQNGVYRAVAFDSEDRFCLDGQQLFPVNGGVYGADGTEYRTERDTFAKIVSEGADATGPGWFRVFLKSGRILTFGGVQASTRIEGRRISRFVPDESQLSAGTDDPFSRTSAVNSFQGRYL